MIRKTLLFVVVLLVMAYTAHAAGYVIHTVSDWSLKAYSWDGATYTVGGSIFVGTPTGAIAVDSAGGIHTGSNWGMIYTEYDGANYTQVGPGTWLPGTKKFASDEADTLHTLSDWSLCGYTHDGAGNYTQVGSAYIGAGPGGLAAAGSEIHASSDAWGLLGKGPAASNYPTLGSAWVLNINAIAADGAGKVYTVSDWGLNYYQWNGSAYVGGGSAWVGPNPRAIELDSAGNVHLLSDWGLLMYSYDGTAFTQIASVWPGTALSMVVGPDDVVHVGRTDGLHAYKYVSGSAYNDLGHAENNPNMIGVATLQTVPYVYNDWDCGRDFDSVSNPSADGVWGYYLYPSGTLMAATAYANLWSPPSGWEDPTQDWIGLYGWSGTGGGGNLEDPNDFAGHNPWMVRWTSPVSGWVRISGRSFQRAEDYNHRLITWRLRHNGVEFNHGYGKQNPADGEPLLGSSGAASFADGVGGLGGLYKQVAVGDTIDLITTGTPVEEFPIPCVNAQPYGTIFICQFTIRTVEVVPTFDLTVIAEPAVVSSIAPPPGTTAIPVGTQQPIVASPYINCPDVMAFDHWTGDGVADPNAASTTVDMSTDRVITAVYVDNRACGDVCHPTWPDVRADLNSDCRINLGDLAMFAGSWLDSTRPEDD